MKVWFSIWGYCDPTRVGYDTVGVTYYHTQKPSSFAGIGSTEVVEVERYPTPIAMKRCAGSVKKRNS